MKKIRKDLIYMKKLKITLKNGRYVEYQEKEFDNWYYDGNAIIVKKIIIFQQYIVLIILFVL